MRFVIYTGTFPQGALYLLKGSIKQLKDYISMQPRKLLMLSVPSRIQLFKLRIGLISVFLLLLNACSTVPKQQPTVIQSEPPAAPVVSYRPFEMDTLYALLVAEMAGDRHRFDIMLSNYVQQAESTRDTGVVSRAARLARYLNTHPIALDMALLWTELEPNSPEAHYIAAAELVYANRLIEAVEHAKFLIAHNETSGFDAIGARAQQGGDVAVTKQLLTEFEPLIQQYPQNQALYIGISLLYQHAGELDKALEYTQKAVTLSPTDFQAKAQETRILQQLGRTDEALAKLGKLVEEYPQNNALRLQYARSLLKSDLVGAQEQFQLLLNQDAENPDLLLTLALIEYERGLLEQAKEHFSPLVNHPRHRAAAHFYLGQIELTHKHFDESINHLKQVGPGPNFLPAMSLLSDVYVSQNQIQTAISLIRDRRQSTPAKLPKQIEGLYLLESQVLTTQGQYLEAIQLLKDAITEFPDSEKLIYSRAMLFTRIDQISAAEKDLKHVLSLTPDNAAALNALGYTLADRTDRIDEAYQYILRAYTLAPDDPAVMDSLGWVEFRRGNNKRALESLHNAMKVMPDHEIAAHLGEVLWVTGDTAQAREVWKTGLKLKPESGVILNTIKRLQADIKE